MGRALYALLIALSLYGGELHSGYAPRYSPGVMERVARNRALPPVDCMVSSPRYPLGIWVWVYGMNTDTLVRCRVTDVSAPQDRQRHLRTRREIEAGYTDALRLCGRRHMQDSPDQCPVLVIRLAE